MAHVRRQADTQARKRERIRTTKLAELRERARQVAEIVARLPADRSQVHESEARAELLHEFALTAAEEADRGKDALELVAEVTDHYAMWFGKDGPRWIRDEHYQASWAEVLQIAAEELQRARGGG